MNWLPAQIPTPVKIRATRMAYNSKLLSMVTHFILAHCIRVKRAPSSKPILIIYNQFLLLFIHISNAALTGIAILAGRVKPYLSAPNAGGAKTAKKPTKIMF
jgi:hypothetical protein